MDSSLHQIPHNHSSYCEARAAEHHCIANGRHKRNIWRAELSKQNSAEAKSEGNKRAADSKYNQSEISHELPRDLTAKHHALPHRAIICASGAYLFMSDMSLFVLNMETHVSYQIIGRIKSSRTKRIARIVVYGKSITESSASERDDVNTATPQHPRSRSSPGTGVQRYPYSNFRERVARRQNARTLQGLASTIRAGGDHK